MDRPVIRFAGWPEGESMGRVGDISADYLRGELAVLAARFVLPGFGPDVNQAITVACELLVRDLDTPATVDVAALAYGTPLRDARPVIVGMLCEQGFPAPRPEASEAEELITVLRAVAAGGLHISELFAFFMWHVPAWEQQDELQRRLVVLLNDWEQEPLPKRKREMGVAVRRAARDAVADAS